MELGIDDIPGEDDKKYKDGMQVGNVLIKTGLPLSLLLLPTRSYAALRAADLDWIVGPGYSLGRVHSGEKP